MPSFFDINLAKEIKSKYGLASIITANNVFAHADNLLEIIQGVKELLDSDSAYQKMAQQTNPYGDGNACQRIIEALRSKHAN